MDTHDNGKYYLAEFLNCGSLSKKGETLIQEVEDYLEEVACGYPEGVEQKTPVWRHIGRVVFDGVARTLWMIGAPLAYWHSSNDRGNNPPY